MPSKTNSDSKVQVPLHIRRRAAQLEPNNSRSALLVPNEDPAKLQTLFTEYHEYFRPSSIVEATLIAQMIFAVWRLHRNAGFESIALTVKAEELLEEHKKTYGTVDYDRLFTQAAEAIAGFTTVLNRTFTTCRNTYRGALADLEKVRKLKGDPNQPFIGPPKIFLFSSHFAEPVSKPPTKIFEMPASAPDPVESTAPVESMAPVDPPAPEEPLDPMPSSAHTRLTGNDNWFECDNYEEPPAPVPPAEPQDPVLPSKPTLYDIHGNPIVIHNQVKPKFRPSDFKWVATPAAEKILSDPIVLDLLKGKKKPH